MSGEGMMAADPADVRAEPIVWQVMVAVAETRRATIVEERAGVLTFARAFCASIDTMIAQGKLPGVDGAALKERVRAFANGIATGLHRDGHEDPGVRLALRELVLRDLGGAA